MFGVREHLKKIVGLAKHLAIATGVALGLGAQTAIAAEIITFSFGGVVRSVPLELASAFSAGQVVSQTYDVDADTDDTDDARTSQGVYAGAIKYWRITVTGDGKDYLAEGNNGDVIVCNWGGPGSCPSFPTPGGLGPFDGVRFFGTSPTTGLNPLPGFTLLSVNANVYDLTTSAINSDAFPASIDAFDSSRNEGRLNIRDATGRTLAVQITLVPEPGTLALLGLGLAGLAATRRRKQ